MNEPATGEAAGRSRAGSELGRYTPKRLLASASRRAYPAKIAVVALTAVVVVAAGIVVVNHESSPHPTSASPTGNDAMFGEQIVLPFTGISGAKSVAVDGPGNVYVLSYAYGNVFELQAGSHTQVEVPFTGLTHPGDLVADRSGNLYVSDWLANGESYKLQADSRARSRMPFTNQVLSLAVDTAGNIFGAGRDQAVVELKAGSSTETRRPFTKLAEIQTLAVDTAGNLYLAGHTDPSSSTGAFFKLPAGSQEPVELPFTGLWAASPFGIAVDITGNVYVTDMHLKRVLKLPAGSNKPVPLPFTELKSPWGIAVDDAGNVYVGDDNRVLKLPVRQ